VSGLKLLEDSPADLKDRLAKSLLFVPLALSCGREGGLFIGQSTGASPPDDEDCFFLLRITASVLRHYYILVLEAERRRLQAQLEESRAEQLKIRQKMAEFQEAERLARETRGFGHFDGSKLLRACLGAAEVSGAAAQKGVELDGRSIPEHLSMYAHRQMLMEAIVTLIRIGIERSGIESETVKSPLRIFLKRGRENSIVFGIEAIGAYLNAGDRQQLLGWKRGRRDGDSPDRGAPPSEPAMKPPEAGAAAGEAEPRAESRTTAAGEAPLEAAPDADSRAGEPGGSPLNAVYKAVRRHKGRFHVFSERLRRSESRPGHWLGKTTFSIELPGSLERLKKPESHSPA
jgi:hypothetical protein